MVFATPSRSSTERYVGHLLVVFAASSRSSTEEPPTQGGSVRLGPLSRVEDYDLGFVDIYDRYLLLHREAALRGMETFLKA